MTGWVNSFVIVEKKVPADSNTEDHSTQKLQICLDPRDLNEALEWEPYYTRSIEEILGKFHGITWFTIADFNKGYWMDGGATPRVQETDYNGIGYWKVPVDKASNEFQHCTGCVPVKTWHSFPQCARSHWNSRWHDHFWKNWSRTWWKSLNFLEVCRKNNLTLNPDKMQFRLPKVSFFGHSWSDKADPKKIEVVKRIEIPQDVEAMRSFLGLINYLSHFEQSKASLTKWPTERNLQTESGIPAYTTLWDCLSML